MLARIPQWVWGVVAFAVFVTFAILLWDWRNRIRKEAVLEQRIEQLQAAVVVAQDSQRSARARTDTIVQVVHRIVPEYRAARARVDTLEVTDTLRIDTIPPNHAVVPIEFVRTADAAVAALPVLEARIRVERMAADSLDRLRVVEIQALKDLNRAQRGGGILNTLTKVGIGVGIGLGVASLLR